MSIFVQIGGDADESTSGLVATVRASGPYSPDVLDDLTRRATELYRKTYLLQVNVGLALADDERVIQEKEQGE